MKTDALFYKFFQLEPDVMMHLCRLDPKLNYRFDSITFKSTERRTDGFFLSSHPAAPVVLFEAQGYKDEFIYWRALLELCMHYEGKQETRPFILVLLFVEESHDPKNFAFEVRNPNQLVRLTLNEMLETKPEGPHPLSALKPLACPNEDQLRQEIRTWKNDLDSLEETTQRKKALLELLTACILARFGTLTLEEVNAMLEFPFLVETQAGKDLIQIGEERGIQIGEERGIQIGEERAAAKGKLAGDIRLTQHMLGDPLTPMDKLFEQDVDTLESQLQALRKQLNGGSPLK